MLELIVFDNCPFCHRCLLVLLEKSASFNTVRVERSRKDESKHLLSPYMRVPVLWHDGRPVHESSIINEYLEEILPTAALLPPDPAQKPWHGLDRFLQHSLHAGVFQSAQGAQS